MAATYSVTANVPVDVAYAYVADLLRHPEWSPDSMEMTAQQPGPITAGSRFTAVGHLVGKPNPSEVEVVAVEPGKRFAFQATYSNSVWMNEFLFTPVVGGTQIDRRMTVLQGPLLLKLIFPIINPLIIRPGHAKSLGMLRDKLEKSPSAI